MILAIPRVSSASYKGGKNTPFALSHLIFTGTANTIPLGCDINLERTEGPVRIVKTERSLALASP
jgi:hypothetical protein